MYNGILGATDFRIASRPINLLARLLRRISWTRPAGVATSPSAQALEKNRTFWVHRPISREIHCLQGTLWLTFDGVRKDVVLDAGQSYRCDSASRLAIHALDAAYFRMD